MKIATWNVNSIRLRLPNLLSWLASTKPDIVCLQELKCTNEHFPYMEIEDAGYNIACHGQKGFNGVALLARNRLEDIIYGIPNFDDSQARYIEAAVSHEHGALRIASLYVPNGNPCDGGIGEKFHYKLAWLDALSAHIVELLKTEEAFVLAGDYNIIPTARDVYNPDAWADDALYHPKTRAAYHRLLNMGLTDALAALDYTSRNTFTFWDYQGGAWQKNNGIRIDHHLLSPQAASHLHDFRILREARSWEKPSDHVPVEIVLAL